MSNLPLAIFYDIIGQDDKAKKIAGVTDTKSKNKYRRKVMWICIILGPFTLGFTWFVALRKYSLIKEDGG